MKGPVINNSLPPKEPSNILLIPPSSKEPQQKSPTRHRQDHSPLSDSSGSNGSHNSEGNALDYTAIMDDDDEGDVISDNARRSLSRRRPRDPMASRPGLVNGFPRLTKKNLSYLIISLLALSTIVQTVRLSEVSAKTGKDTSFSPSYASGNLRGTDEGDASGNFTVARAADEGNDPLLFPSTSALADNFIGMMPDGGANTRTPEGAGGHSTTANTSKVKSGYDTNGMAPQAQAGYATNGMVNTGTQPIDGAPLNVMATTMSGLPSDSMGQQYAQGTTNTMLQGRSQTEQAQGSSYTSNAAAIGGEYQMPGVPGQVTGSAAGSYPNSLTTQSQQLPQQQQQQQQQQGIMAPVSTMAATNTQYQPGASAMKSMMTQPGAYGQSEPTLVQPGVIPSLELVELSNFKDTWDARAPTDVPVLFRLGADEPVERLMTSCHRLIMSSDGGKGHEADPALAVINVPAKEGTFNERFLNIDTTTTSGIQRAIQLGFATSSLGNAIISPFIFETNHLLQPNASLMGRFFALFYHPVERTVLVYERLKQTDPEVGFMNLLNYVSSTKIENNFLTRKLSNQPVGELTEDHMKVALEIIRRKFLVGLGKYIPASFFRFEQYYHWTFRVNPLYQEQCRDQILKNIPSVDMPAEGTTVWQLIEVQNQFDLQLYGYIESLFAEQAQFVTHVPETIRNDDATCCECDPPTLPAEGYECPFPVQQ